MTSQAGNSHRRYLLSSFFRTAAAGPREHVIPPTGRSRPAWFHMYVSAMGLAFSETVAVTGAELSG